MILKLIIEPFSLYDHFSCLYFKFIYLLNLTLNFLSFHIASYQSLLELFYIIWHMIGFYLLNNDLRVTGLSRELVIAGWTPIEITMIFRVWCTITTIFLWTPFSAISYTWWPNIYDWSCRIITSSWCNNRFAVSHHCISINLLFRFQLVYKLFCNFIMPTFFLCIISWLFLPFSKFPFCLFIQIVKKLQLLW